MTAITGYLKNIKIVHKPATETTDAIDILEFKVESPDSKFFKEVYRLEKGKLFIELRAAQGELPLEEGGR